MVWKYIPPPYNQDKPITLPKGRVPTGARFANLRTPAETVQMIGRSGSKVPDRISIDSGVVDIFIGRGGNRITYRDYGLRTNVGKRDPGNTVGMSVPGSEPPILRPLAKRRPTRKGLLKRSHRMGWRDRLTSLKGFRP